LSIARELLDILPQEGIILIAGGIGQGKSCLGYGIAEDLSQQDDRPIYAFNFPQAKINLLPKFITPIYDENFPEHSIVIADEAYFAFYAKDHTSEANKFMDKFSGLARQKGILTIFITQTTRKLSLAAVSGVQVMLIKCPDVMMVDLDRGQLRKRLTSALNLFTKLDAGNRQSATYVRSIDFTGLINNSNTPPSFWTEGLSRAWEDVDIREVESTPVKTSTQKGLQKLLIKQVIPSKICPTCGREAYDILEDQTCELCRTPGLN